MQRLNHILQLRQLSLQLAASCGMKWLKYQAFYLANCSQDHRKYGAYER